MRFDAAWADILIPNKAGYVAGLLQTNLTETRRCMLRTHAMAPNHTISMIEMSREVWGQNSQSNANRHYGRFAGELRRIVGIMLPEGAPNLCAIGIFKVHPSGRLPLTMHQSLVDALTEIGVC